MAQAWASWSDGRQHMCGGQVEYVLSHSQNWIHKAQIQTSRSETAIHMCDAQIEYVLSHLQN